MKRVSGRNRRHVRAVAGTSALSKGAAAAKVHVGPGGDEAKTAPRRPGLRRRRGAPGDDGGVVGHHDGGMDSGSGSGAAAAAAAAERRAAAAEAARQRRRRRDGGRCAARFGHGGHGTRRQVREAERPDRTRGSLPRLAGGRPATRRRRRAAPDSTRAAHVRRRQLAPPRAARRARRAGARKRRRGVQRHLLRVCVRARLQRRARPAAAPAATRRPTRTTAATAATAAATQRASPACAARSSSRRCRPMRTPSPPTTEHLLDDGGHRHERRRRAPGARRGRAVTTLASGQSQYPGAIAVTGLRRLLDQPVPGRRPAVRPRGRRHGAPAREQPRHARGDRHLGRQHLLHAGSVRTADGRGARVPIGGGATTTIASGQNTPASVAVGKSSVFWTTQTDLMFAALNGGRAQTFASMTYPYAVAADGTNVYWMLGHRQRRRLPGAGRRRGDR